VSWLGEPALTAGVGFAAQVLFFIISVNIGLSIAVSAVVARAIGAHDRPRAQQLASSGLVLSFIIASATGLALFLFRRQALELLGARGAALDAAEVYLVWTLPTNGLMALGMALSGVLRAVGDARRSMARILCSNRRRKIHSSSDFTAVRERGRSRRSSISCSNVRARCSSCARTTCSHRFALRTSCLRKTACSHA
jgi:hypothetical protein